MEIVFMLAGLRGDLVPILEVSVTVLKLCCLTEL